MAGMKVFGYVVPACAVVRLWITAEAQNAWIIYGSNIGLMIGENLAMSYTMYCLFQLYVSTHDILHEYKPTDKFVAIKAILGIAVLQDMIIKVVIKKFITKEGYFTDEMLSEFWADFALCCEAILLALAHKKAYPSYELADEGGVHAARRAAARTHALEQLAVPKAHGHGHHAAGEEEDAEAPAVSVVEINPLATGPWTPDMDAQAWPDDAEAPAGAAAGQPALPPAAPAVMAPMVVAASRPASAPPSGGRQGAPMLLPHANSDAGETTDDERPVSRGRIPPFKQTR